MTVMADDTKVDGTVLVIVVMFDEGSECLYTYQQLRLPSLLWQLPFLVLVT